MDNFLVIGGGSAGCVIARRLSDNMSVNVILLEAGATSSATNLRDPKQWPFLGKSNVDWSFETVPQAHTNSRVHSWSRAHSW